MKVKLGICGIIFIFCNIVLYGCSNNVMEVNIYDCQTRTRLIAKEGQTVQELLEEAEISVESQDIVTPQLDSKITADQAKIQIKRHANVTVVTQDSETAVDLTGGKVKDALKAAGVTLVENDYVNHSQEAYLTDGMRVSVVHRMEVSLVADGKTKKCLTQAHTVQEFLEEQRIILGESDRVIPKISGELSNGGKVVVKRVEIREIVVEEPIEFETNITYSNSLFAGTSQITKEGVNGEKRVTYQVTYVDGREESRRAVKEEILKEAVTQEVVQGSKPKGKTVVSKERVDDCDGSGHGFYIITYSDGSVEYQDF